MPTCLAITLCIVSLVAIWFRSSCLLGQLIMLKIHTVVVRLLPIPEIRGSNPVIGKFLSIINCIEKTKIKKDARKVPPPKKNSTRLCGPDFNFRHFRTSSSRLSRRSRAAAASTRTGQVMGSTPSTCQWPNTLEKTSRTLSTTSRPASRVRRGSACPHSTHSSPFTSASSFSAFPEIRSSW